MWLLGAINRCQWYVGCPGFRGFREDIPLLRSGLVSTEGSIMLELGTWWNQLAKNRVSSLYVIQPFGNPIDLK